MRLFAFASILACCAATSIGCGPAHPTTSTPVGAPVDAPTIARLGTVIPLGDTRGYLVAPKENGGGAKHPAIVLVHEWWGLNDWIEGDADRFAAQGYVALAVDLYRGKVAKDAEAAHELMRGLPTDRAVTDMESAFHHLESDPTVDPARIGAIGWCMGGGLALQLALAEPKLRAVVINYGGLVTKKESIDSLHAAVLGNFAGEDEGITPADVAAFGDALKAAGKEVDVKVYPGAKHAFMNPNNTHGFDAKAADDAWSRVDAFFARTLAK